MSQQSSELLEQYKKHFNQFCSDTDKKLINYPIFARIQETTNARPSHVSIGASVFFLLFLLFGIGSTALCNLIGFVYPTYASFKALRTESTEDDKQWLTYWIVFAFFVVLESVTDVIMSWIPFYFFVKVVFLCWCYFPQTRGAERIYVLIIEKVLLSIEDSVDAFMNKPATPKDIVQDIGNDASKAFNTMKNKVNKGFSTLSKQTLKDFQNEQKNMDANNLSSLADKMD